MPTPLEAIWLYGIVPLLLVAALVAIVLVHVRYWKEQARKGETIRLPWPFFIAYCLYCVFRGWWAAGKAARMLLLLLVAMVIGWALWMHSLKAS